MSTRVLCALGTGGHKKMDEFSEKFQTAFDLPTPSISENYVAIFFFKFHFQKFMMQFVSKGWLVIAQLKPPASQPFQKALLKGPKSVT